ncbi:MAG: hypothetical protein ABSH06_17860 [Thermodesulfobacteriota bacterium]
MWPSRETASIVYDLANLGLIVGLVLGVVATGLIVWMGNRKEAYLKLDVTNANAVADTAKENAAKANERAAALEVQAASLDKEAQDAKLQQEKLKGQLETAKENAAKANERAAALEVRAASLDKEAQNAKLEQEKLKAQLSWRTLTPKMLEEVTSVISTTKSSVTLAYTANDPEALFLAIQISKAFENAKWDVRAESRTYATRIVFGVTIPGPVNNDVELVRKAFRAAGIPFSTTDVPSPDMAFTGPGETPVMVMIGSKPPPF